MLSSSSSLSSFSSAALDDKATSSSSVRLDCGEVDLVVWRWTEFVGCLVVIVDVLLSVFSSALDAVATPSQIFVPPKAYSIMLLMASIITLLQLDMIFINY